MTNSGPSGVPAGGNDTTVRVAEQERYRHALAQKPGDATAVPALVALLGDPSWRVRKTAVAMLDRFAGTPTLVPALIAGLASDDNAGLRNACSEALVRIGDAAVPVLATALQTDDPDHRRFTTEVLGAIGGDEARDALIDRLDDADINVRVTAAEALGRIGDTPSIDAVRGRLAGADGDLMEEVYLLEALARARTRLPYDDLALRLERTALARPLYSLLADAADCRAVGPLVQGLNASAKATRAAAAVSLALLHSGAEGRVDCPVAGALEADASARGRLLEMLEHESDEVVGAAVRLLGSMADPAMAPAILGACSCRPLVDRATQVVCAMGPGVLDALLDAFEKQDIESRVLFLEVLELLGDETIVARLLEVGAGPEGRSAESAVRVVGTLGGKAAIEPLMTLARTVSPELAHAAALSLVSLGERHEEAVVTEVRRALDDGDVRPTWVTVLGGIGRDEDVDAVVAATRNTDAAVRRAAVDAAAGYGNRFPSDTLVFTLADEDPEVRAAAARALGTVGSAEAADALIAGVHDSDPWVVAAAVASLGQTRDPRAVEVALAAAHSRSSPIAIAALQSLFRLNPPQLPKAAKTAMTHIDPEVVREAIALTMRMPPQPATGLLVDALRHRAWSVRSAAAETLLSRGLSVPSDVIDGCLLEESEPLVREALERLSTEAGGAA